MSRIHWRLNWKLMLTVFLIISIFTIITLSMLDSRNSAKNEATQDGGVEPVQAPASVPHNKSLSASGWAAGIWLDQTAAPFQRNEEASSNANGSNFIDSLSAVPTTSKQSGGIDPTTLADLLPHLIRLRPNLKARRLLYAKNLLRSPPELVLMIPSTHRKGSNYLMNTLRNLVQNIAEPEKHMAQIVVMLSENQWDVEREAKLTQTVKQIGDMFGQQVDEGLIEVISPPDEWFPPGLEHIQSTLGDSPERTRWRSKQNLDYAFAMLHVHRERPTVRYYVQLEDDIITVPNFISELRQYANARPKFFLAEFSNLGFIGRMFHNNNDLAHMAHFILLLYQAQPVDWVLSHVLSSKFCSLGETFKQCQKKRLTNIVLFKRWPPLFQHVGKHSSLPGKLQNLTEKQFGKNEKISVAASENPEANQFHGPLHEENVEQRLHALYERMQPFQVDLAMPQEMNWLEIVFTPRPLAQLRALRIFFSIKFNASMASPEPSPSSFSPLLVRISHATDEDEAFSGRQPDHFLLIPRQPLRLVRSIRIGFTPGDWQKEVRALRLTAIKVLS